MLNATALLCNVVELCGLRCALFSTSISSISINSIISICSSNSCSSCYCCCRSVRLSGRPRPTDDAHRLPTARNAFCVELASEPVDHRGLRHYVGICAVAKATVARRSECDDCAW